jgi:streptogramin lyase
MDASGNYWIAETDRVRKVSGGIIATAAGTGIYGYTGDGGSAASATLASPLGVAEDPSGNLFIADNWNKVIRKVDTTGTITTFFNDPAGVDFVSLTTDAAGNVYSVDRGECVVRQISPSGVGTIVAGVLGTCGYNSDGIAATAAQLKAPYGVALDSAGNIFIGDAGNNRVRKVTLSTGLISTVAGTCTCNFSGDGGLATAATLCAPSGVVVDPNGRLFIADYFNFRVRLVDTTRKISTYAGTGIPGFNNNGRKATSTNLGGPISVALSPSNILYISDDVNYRIRVIQ